MKRLFVALIAVATMFAQDAFAQQSQKSEAQRAEMNTKREQFMHTRLDLCKTDVNLTPDQVKFEPVYRSYRSDIHKITTSNKDARTKKENITNENALKVVSARLTNNVLTSTIKQRYLLIFAEVIEPLQVMKLYGVDDKVSREAHKIIKYQNSTTATENK